MKDSLLIDSGLPVNIWAQAMDTANYLCIQLLTRCSGPAFIPDEAWISIRQNLEHLQIFESSVNILISNEKRTKVDIWKTWQGIFIGYTETTKYLRVWASCMHQVLIASKPVVNKSKRSTDLLIKHLMLSPAKSLQ